MRRNGIPAEFAERIYRQILGFGVRFPESHSVSCPARLRFRLAQAPRAGGVLAALSM
jgi:hypothetical protein